MESFYINNNLVLSLEDLKTELQKIEDSHSYSARQIIICFKNGFLQDWLSEGTPEEKDLIPLINKISQNSSDFQIVQSIKSIICGNKSNTLKKINFKDCLRCVGVDFSYNKDCDFLEIKNNQILIRDPRKIYFRLQIEVCDFVNEEFNFSVKKVNSKVGTYSIVYDQHVDFSQYRKGDKLTLYFDSYNDEDYRYELLVDGSSMYTISVSYLDCLNFSAESDNSWVSLECKNGDSYEEEYSTTGEKWQPYSFGEKIKLIHKGDFILFRAKKKIVSYSSFSNFHFTMGGLISAHGNVMSLIDNTMHETSALENLFVGLFSKCTCLISAPNLPAFSLSKGCYSRMFEGCTKLIKAPELPSRQLAKSCYEHMFEGCSSLKKAPDLPSTVLSESCYDHMFEGCVSLSEAPVLPSGNLMTRCYRGMFLGCTSLCNAPQLSALMLAESCYESMFEDCANLREAPNLPAKKLSDFCYEKMFKGCLSLANPPKLPSMDIALCCYRNMFEGCVQLVSSPDLHATNLERGCYTYMFLNCTNLKEVSDLPASTLAPRCYLGMFQGCIRLSEAPKISAPHLPDSCCEDMFLNCENIVLPRGYKKSHSEESQIQLAEFRRFMDHLQS